MKSAKSRVPQRQLLLASTAILAAGGAGVLSSVAFAMIKKPEPLFIASALLIVVGICVRWKYSRRRDRGIED